MHDHQAKNSLGLEFKYCSLNLSSNFIFAIFAKKKDIDYDSVGWLKTKRSVINLINSPKTKWRLGRSWGILAMTLTNILFVKLSLIMMLM